MLNKLILETAAHHSYSEAALNNIKSTSQQLQSTLSQTQEFMKSLIGGSYKRGTLVKGISDIDIYVEYTGKEQPSVVLGKLKAHLISNYPDTDIRKDKPSVLVEFRKIPFNVTPFKLNQNHEMIIPNRNLTTWQHATLAKLEKDVNILKGHNQHYIDLIKILKLWNYRYERGYENFRIEELVVNLFTLLTQQHKKDVSDWLVLFFRSNNLHNDSVKFSEVRYARSEGELKNKWSKFINNQ